ncbi:MAG: hypothetical protein KFF72_18395, partial [Arthrospira sp. SH-MAG29]
MEPAPTIIHYPLSIIHYPLITGWVGAGLLIWSVGPLINCGTRPYNYPLSIINYPLITGWVGAGLLIWSVG